jgi:hypothetical protein
LQHGEDLAHEVQVVGVVEVLPHVIEEHLVHVVVHPRRVFNQASQRPFIRALGDAALAHVDEDCLPHTISPPVAIRPVADAPAEVAEPPRPPAVQHHLAAPRAFSGKRHHRRRGVQVWVRRVRDDAFSDAGVAGERISPCQLRLTDGLLDFAPHANDDIALRVVLK